MGKMSFRNRQALKQTLSVLRQTNNGEILCCGINKRTQEHFCKPVRITSVAKRFLSCTRLEIRGIGYYVEVEQKIVSWLKEHIRLPTNKVWETFVSPHNWLKYNVADNLYILNLGIGSIEYYLILRAELVLAFRQSAFKYNS